MQGGSLSYEWVNLSGLDLISDAASLEEPSVIMEIPQITQATTFKIKLIVTDENDKSTSQEIELRAKAQYFTTSSFGKTFWDSS